MPFYPNAMNKARVRVASVRVLERATLEEAFQVQDEANQYMHEMRCDAEPDDDGVLHFFYAHVVDMIDIGMIREMRQAALGQLFEWARERDDFAPIITDRVH